MALDYKKIALALVVKAYNVTTERAAEILNEADEERTDNDAINDILDLNKAKIKETRTKAFDDGHKKAKAEALAEFEQSIRDEYEVSDTSLKGADLIKSVVQSQNKQENGNNAPALTDDAVKKHPLYIQLQDTSKAAIKKATEDATAKVTEVEKGYKQKETLASVRKEAGEEFDRLNPVLPTDAKLATNQRNLFIESVINGKNFDKQGNRTVILDAEGKVVEDEHGNAITLTDLVKTNASQTFAFKKTDVGGGSGSKTGADGQPLPGKTQFKNEAAFMAYANDNTVPIADRIAASTAWEAAQVEQAAAE